MCQSYSPLARWQRENSASFERAFDFLGDYIGVDDVLLSISTRVTAGMRGQGTARKTFSFRSRGATKWPPDAPFGCAEPEPGPLDNDTPSTFLRLATTLKYFLRTTHLDARPQNQFLPVRAQLKRVDQMLIMALSVQIQHSRSQPFRVRRFAPNRSELCAAPQFTPCPIPYD